jgi:lipopolysaccharide biosynthesis regulator YciM
MFYKMKNIDDVSIEIFLEDDNDDEIKKLYGKYYCTECGYDQDDNCGICHGCGEHGTLKLLFDE